MTYLFLKKVVPEKIFYVIFLVIFFSSCYKNPEVPLYVFIPEIKLETTAAEGSASENITDAWIYQNGNFQGVYELPVRFPILFGDGDELQIFGGIKINGVSATRAIYPFFTADSAILNAAAAEVDTFIPILKYAPFTVFDLNEDFEGSNNFTNLEVANSEIFEGNFSARVKVEDSSEVFVLTNTSFEIPFSTSAFFMEFDYKNNHIFEIGVRVAYVADTFSVYKLTVAPREEWNKIYVNFTPEINGTQANSYQFFFRIVPEMQADSINIFFDNIKLLHIGG